MTYDKIVTPEVSNDEKQQNINSSHHHTSSTHSSTSLGHMVQYVKIYLSCLSNKNRHSSVIKTTDVCGLGGDSSQKMSWCQLFCWARDRTAAPAGLGPGCTKQNDWDDAEHNGSPSLSVLLTRAHSWLNRKVEGCGGHRICLGGAFCELHVLG